MDFDTIYNLILTGALGIISFFLKRSYDVLDSRASKPEVTELKEQIKGFDDKYASKSELNELKKTIDKISDKIDDIKDNGVRNEEFIRSVTRLETKIDNIIDTSRRD